MPDLLQILQDYDPSLLNIIAGFWDVTVDAADRRSAARTLAAQILDRYQLRQQVSSLPAEARAGLEDLANNQGRIAWGVFERRFGSVRTMGAGRRDRLRPYLDPSSPAEMLWYRGLISRGFFDSPDGLQEFALIPDDLLSLLLPREMPGDQSLGRPATPAERVVCLSADDHLIDHATTLLAGIRAEMPLDQLSAYISDPPHVPGKPFPLRVELLRLLLIEGGLLTGDKVAVLESVRSFLEGSRGEALALLARAWLGSIEINDLRHLPGLTFDGEWQNDPLRTRQKILGFISHVPYGTWWSLPAFTTAIKTVFPDFQRPSGDYDSWFIRKEGSDQFLRGFDAWDDVEGALLRYMIAGPLHWLGILDVALPDSDSDDSAGRLVSAFQLTRWAPDLLKGIAPLDLPGEDQRLTVLSDARIQVPRLVPRATRYQVARFSAWRGYKGEDYLYRLTPRSLRAARQQGLRTDQILTILRRSAKMIPPNMVRALERWENQGSQARLEKAVMLRVSSPEVLQALRGSRAARFLDDVVGPTTVIIKANAWEKVLAALAELGFLGEIDEDLEESSG